ncbi:TetR/AcrR family transcriptional regulator [Actinomadura sp. 9N407]|uniref:TetR/AcrR family transcriptional regulator n=1 Tax=Actinomadura sp. 9N407 TaxID=3375154 RepID=UPI00378CA330
MPPQNLKRRHALADAAIEVLGTRGAHGLSHRAVDETAGLPAGTASNYHRSREALFTAAMERAAELHLAEMEAANAQAGTSIDRSQLIELLGYSLLVAADQHRTRYLAVYELALEATRRPELQKAYAQLMETSVQFTIRQHRLLGLDTSPEDVRTLIQLYANTLFGLLTGPPEHLSETNTRALARAMVNGTLG